MCIGGAEKPRSSITGAPRPTYQESDFKPLCRVSSGHLPLRQEWLELMEAKSTNEYVKLACNAIGKNHNDTHNPSGKPLEFADRKRTAFNAKAPISPGG